MNTNPCIYPADDDLVDRMTTCAFTGHRPERFPFGSDETHPDCLRLKERLRRIISLLPLLNGTTRFLTGCAPGVDLWAAEAVLSLQQECPSLQLVCVIPFPEQERDWIESLQKRYRHVLERASQTVLVNDRFTGADCYYRRNRYLVDHADMLLAVVDPCRRSGAGMTFRYAQRCSKPIYHLDPRSLELEIVNYPGNRCICYDPRFLR